MKERYYGLTIFDIRNGKRNEIITSSENKASLVKKLKENDYRILSIINQVDYYLEYYKNNSVTLTKIRKRGNLTKEEIEILRKKRRESKLKNINNVSRKELKEALEKIDKKKGASHEKNNVII